MDQAEAGEITKTEVVVQKLNQEDKENKMSKFSEQLKKDLCAIKKGTKDLIKGGGKLAFEEYHDVSSLEKLKKKLKGGEKQ